MRRCWRGGGRGRGGAAAGSGAKLLARRLVPLLPEWVGEGCWKSPPGRTGENASPAWRGATGPEAAPGGGVLCQPLPQKSIPVWGRDSLRMVAPRWARARGALEHLGICGLSVIFLAAQISCFENWAESFVGLLEPVAEIWLFKPRLGSHSFLRLGTDL